MKESGQEEDQHEVLEVIVEENLRITKNVRRNGKAHLGNASKKRRIEEPISSQEEDLWERSGQDEDLNELWRMTEESCLKVRRIKAPMEFLLHDKWAGNNEKLRQFIIIKS